MHEYQKLNARKLRNNMTEQERKIWNIIKNRQFYGYRFLRQYAIGDYIVDFVCRSKFIAIEIDGGQHNQDVNAHNDKIRTQYLENQGYQVIRFWNNEIDSNIEGVYLSLKQIFEIEE